MTRGVVLRGFGLAVAVVLAGVAAWLIVTGKTQRRLELGVLAGLWSALVAAFAMFGSRRFVHPLDEEEYDSTPGAELELRARDIDLERAEEAAARRVHEARLEHMLRNEIRMAISREVSALRSEIAELRSELLEKVGGQLRLERIETTRVIGSDLEALQHEVRQLKAAAQEAELGMSRMRQAEPAAVRPIVETARIRPVSRETAEVEADVQPARTHVEPASPKPAEAVPRAPAGASNVPPVLPAPTPAPTPAPPGPAAGSHSAAAPTPRPSPSPVPSASSPADSFAALPRIRPFTEFALDPVEPTSPSYTGRRRADEQPANGRHARPDDGAGRRHRAEEDEGHQLLARLLAREGGVH